MHLKLNTTAFLGTLLAFCMSVSAVNAGAVTLKSLDGSVTMKGDLVAFDGEHYTLNVLLGQLEIAASDVTCEGAGCPELVNSDFRLTGSSTLTQFLIPSLFQEFSDANNLKVTTEDEIFVGDIPVRPYVFSDANGDVFANIEIHTEVSSEAFAGLLEGSAEIALSSRLLHQPSCARLLRRVWAI